jgi:hypothetical protein
MYNGIDGESKWNRALIANLMKRINHPLNQLPKSMGCGRLYYGRNESK